MAQKESLETKCDIKSDEHMIYYESEKISVDRDSLHYQQNRDLNTQHSFDDRTETTIHELENIILFIRMVIKQTIYDQRLEKEHALAIKEKEKETIVSQLKASEELNKVLKSELETVKGDLRSQIMAIQIQENDFKTTLSKTEKRFRDELNEWKTNHNNATKEHQKSTKEVKELNKKKEKLDDKLKDQKKANLELFEKQTRQLMEMETYKKSLREANTTIKNNEAVNAKQYTQLQQQRSQLQQQRSQLQQHVSTIQQQTNHINKQNKNISDLETSLEKSEEERNKLNLRLRQLAGAHLTHDNPNIADLSDENRPTKLAEKYSELFDNEWTDAFEELCDLSGKDEMTSIGEMLDLLKTTYEECVQLSKPHRDTLRNLTTVTLNVNKCLVKDKGQTITDISFEDQCVQTEITCIGQSFQADIGDDCLFRGSQGRMQTNQLENGDRTSIELSGRRNGNDEQAPPSNNDNEQNSHTTTDLHNSDTSNIGEPSHEVKDTEVHNLPEGFSTSGDTGEITAEVEVQVVFSAEQKKTVSEMMKVCATKLEQEKELSKVIALKVAFERNIDAVKQTHLMAYITKCAQLCWYMVIQEPPVVIEFQDKVTGAPFNKDVYKAYTKIGKMLDFIVWPPLYLHKNGPMLSKGTAQGTE